MVASKSKLAIYTVVLSLLTLIGVSGCAQTPITTVVAKQLSQQRQRVLVIPFSNNSDEKRFETVATQICQNQCYRHGCEVVNAGDLRTFLQRKRLLLSQLTEEGSSQLYAELARELQVDTLIRGKILEVTYQQVQGESLPIISLQLDLLQASNGKLLANSFLTGRGEDYRTIMRFGVLRTSTQLLNQMIDNILNNWHDKGVLL